MLFLSSLPTSWLSLSSEVPAAVWVLLHPASDSESIFFPAGTTVHLEGTGVFLLTQCLHLFVPYNCASRTRNASDRLPCHARQKKIAGTDLKLLEDLNISFIHNWKEKENSGTESPNLYSDCIIYIGVKEGICMRIKGNPHPYCEPTPRS